MDTIISWSKDNYQLICLALGVIGVVIAFISLVNELKKKKLQK